MEVPKEMKAWRAHAYGAEGNPADTIGKMTLDTALGDFFLGGLELVVSLTIYGI
jgi:hypothetical protein